MEAHRTEGEQTAPIGSFRWRSVGLHDGDLPPDGQVVETKIDDADGVRNVQTLKRQGNLWFVPDGSMYVYYRPTHWRPAGLREARS